MTQTSRKHVSVIIATYNRADTVARCVESVLASDYAPLEVIVVDDCSPDDTANVLTRRFGADPRFRLIRNETNLMTCASRNRGARVAKGAYLLFLDHDNVVQPDLVRRLAACLNDDPKLGLVGPITVNHGLNNEGEIWTLGSDFNRWTSQPKDFRPHTKASEFFAGEVPALLSTTYIPNASMTRREIFEAIGGFDDSIMMMFDESDYGWRIVRAGWTAAICPAARTDHHHEGGGDDCNSVLRHLGIEKPRRAFYFGRNRPWFAKRHFSFLQTLAVMSVFAPLSAVYYGWVALRRHRPDIAWAYLKGTCVGMFTRPPRRLV